MCAYRDKVISIYNGELIFLPSSKSDHTECMRLLSKTNKDHEGDNSLPKWPNLIQVEGEKEINSKILDTQATIGETVAQKDVLLLKCAELRKPLNIY